LEGTVLKFEEFRYVACQNRHICATLAKIRETGKQGATDPPSFAEAEKALDIFKGLWEILLLRGLPWLYTQESWKEVKTRIVEEKTDSTSESQEGKGGIVAILEALEEEVDPEARIAWERLGKKLTSWGEDPKS